MKYNNLFDNEVKKRQEKYGKNILPEEKPIPAIKLFLSQFINPLVYILCSAGLVSFFLHKFLDVFLILSVVIINALMGFFQENKTQKTLATLKKLIKPIAKVLRNNEKKEIEASNLVPGDIVFLGIGDRVPADGKILETVSFFVNEAILTGESLAVVKEEKDEVYMGTTVVSGRAIFQVEKIGLMTKIGKIAQTLKETKEVPTTLQIRLKKMTKTLIYISVFLSVLIFVFGFLKNYNFLEMLELSAVILVAIIPEALLIVITLVLVLAMHDSLKKKALIRKILAIETLGSVTTICIDKTGTLTEGVMKITETDFTNLENSHLAMCLCNDINNTVEIAIWDYLKNLKNFDQQKIFDDSKRISEISFNSQNKYMASLNILPNDSENFFWSVKGAPEIILEMCDIKESEKNLIIEKVNQWADKGLKILAFASKKVPRQNWGNQKDNLSNLEWGGIIGLSDPVRKEVKYALEVAKNGGLKIKVITGDYRRTAEKIMEFLGIKVNPEQVIEGAELELLSDFELKERVPNIILFTRTTPEQKLRIVNVLQELGEIVAMMGDGVNDAPAIKKSNIGIVVGSASEVAKETADLILLDNNFKTIVSAVEGGRLVFENIKKIILFILSNSFAEVVVIMGTLFLGWPFPLTIVQILWIHLLCDGPEDFILGFEPKEKETMLDGPKRMDDPILDKTGIFMIIFISVLSGIISLAFFWYFGIKENNLALGQTMAFMSLAFSSITYIFSFRTLRKPFWKYENFWSNKWLFIIFGLSLLLAIVITYLPATQKLLNIIPLSTIHWQLILAKSLLVIVIIEIIKIFMKSNKKSKIMAKVA